MGRNVVCRTEPQARSIRATWGFVETDIRFRPLRADSKPHSCRFQPATRGFDRISAYFSQLMRVESWRKRTPASTAEMQINRIQTST
jgi:hypothetical protein